MFGTKGAAHRHTGDNSASANHQPSPAFLQPVMSTASSQQHLELITVYSIVSRPIHTVK